MTLAEIDRLRGFANEALERYRAMREVGNLREQDEAELTLIDARRHVDDALRGWWAQGCQVPEVPR